MAISKQCSANISEITAVRIYTLLIKACESETESPGARITLLMQLRPCYTMQFFL
jgi:hypothetical protein